MMDVEVLTHDGDFGRLGTALDEPFVGILYLRPGPIQPSYTIETLTALLRRNLDLSLQFVVVGQRSGDTIRVRIGNL